jgi:predicted AAA+ superfamily ATPase
MERLIYQNLIAWKRAAGRKPLMLEGARQVGKTYLLKKLGREEYKHFYYLNFDETPDARTMFEGNISAASILKKLSIYFQTQITPENSLICFDEIQECDGALASLKYFCEDAPEYHVAVAGSLLGVKLKGNKGFPVGKVTIRHLYPLSFIEYLHAINKSGWVKLLTELSIHEKVTAIFHKELTEELKTYFFVGGMPEAIAKYIQSNSLEEVRQIHKDILRTYELDFAKHATPAEAAKISLVWDTIPSQLAKENKKFIYSVIKESARAREYESAIQWLVDARLILKSYYISKPSVPLKSYADHEIFKTYFLDIGLLGAMSQLKSKILLEGDQLFMEYKGALTENYIAQSLTTFLEHQLFYWASEGKAEVDFIVDIHGAPIPIEVKSGLSTKKRSLHVYCDKYSPAISIRTSPMNIALDGTFLNIPLYAISELPRLLNSLFAPN